MKRQRSSDEGDGDSKKVKSNDSANESGNIRMIEQAHGSQETTETGADSTRLHTGVAAEKPDNSDDTTMGSKDTDTSSNVLPKDTSEEAESTAVENRPEPTTEGQSEAAPQEGSATETDKTLDSKPSGEDKTDSEPVIKVASDSKSDLTSDAKPDAKPVEAEVSASNPSKGFSSFSKGGFGSFGSFGSLKSGGSSFAAAAKASPWAETNGAKSNPWAETKNPWAEKKADADSDANEKDTSKAETSKAASVEARQASEDAEVYAQVTLEKQEVKTGEEGEDVQYSTRVRLYAIDLTSDSKAWKERGVGILKLNRSKNDGGETKYRLVLRTDSVLKVSLNLLLLDNMQVSKGFESSLHTEKFVRVAGLENGKAHQFAMRCGTEETRDELFDAIDGAIASIQSASEA